MQSRLERKYRRWERDVAKEVNAIFGSEIATQFLNFPITEFCGVRLDAQLNLLRALEVGLEGQGLAAETFNVLMEASKARWTP